MSITVGLLLALAAGLLLAACGPSDAPATVPPTAAARASPEVPAATAGPNAVPTNAPAAEARPTPDLSRARFSTTGWKTDFTKASVPFQEITSGGPPRDGIPPIDRPTFETTEQAGTWLGDKEPVIHLRVGQEARAYPLQILIWHEIVNDEVGGVPVAVTFCPLCNTAIAFERRLDGRVLDFGTTGNLRHSDLVMWDRQTESWWQQVTGEAIVGELTGKKLTMLPASIVAWDEFQAQSPGGRVLSRQTGFSRAYGQNPYVGYDQIDQSPFLFAGKPDDRLAPMERVATVNLGGEDVAYPYALLRQHRVVADRVGGQPVVVFYQPGTASALDGPSIAASRDVGAATAFRPEVDGRELTFAWRDDAFVDRETDSRWSLLGQATAGPLAGKQLEPVVSGSHFWFAWAAFKPDTRIWRPA